MLRVVLFFCLMFSTQCRKHKLELQEDSRRQITLSTFGFLKGGTLTVNVSLLSYNFIPLEPNQKFPQKANAQFGFTLSKNANTEANDYLQQLQKRCVLDPKNMFSKDNIKTDDINVVLITLMLQDNSLNIQRIGKHITNLTIEDIYVRPEKEAQVQKRSVFSLTDQLSDSFLYGHLRQKRDATAPKTSTSAPTSTPAVKPSSTKPVKSAAPTLSTKTPKPVPPGVTSAVTAAPSGGSPGDPSTTQHRSNNPVLSRIPLYELEKITRGYSFQFKMEVNQEIEEGLYNLYFHNCYGASNLSSEFGTEVNLTIEIEENNNGNYLSAGEMPLPNLYFFLCLVFFVLGGIWLVVLRRARDDVFKIHFLMLTVVCLKGLSLLFHAIHYHFIQVEGTQEETWAVLYYIAYLMKVTLLFLTILLIGAGWAFVKHLLSEKEKKLFIIFIPLQILANVAFIIVEESEEGMSQYTTWKEIFILVDLLCCGAILFPVVWSIRHLQDASHTDGKAAMNLNKLKLFRHFYILVVCYIYFTRIIVYLLQITVPFKYSWLYELFKQMAILFFFVVTGMKFRPAPDNPYLQVPTDSDDEIEMDEVLTKTGVLETVVKMNRKESSTGESTVANKRESSHEYD